MDRYSEYRQFARLDNPGWMTFPLPELIDLVLAHSRTRLPREFASRPNLYMFSYGDVPLYVGAAYRGTDSPAAWKRLCNHVSGQSDIGRCIHGSWPAWENFKVYAGHSEDVFPAWRKVSTETFLIYTLRPVFNRQSNPAPLPIPDELVVAPFVLCGMRNIRALVQFRNNLPKPIDNGAVSWYDVPQITKAARAGVTPPNTGLTSQES